MADFNVSLEKAKFFLQSQYHDEEKWALNMNSPIRDESCVMVAGCEWLGSRLYCVIVWPLYPAAIPQDLFRIGENLACYVHLVVRLVMGKLIFELRVQVFLMVHMCPKLLRAAGLFAGSILLMRSYGDLMAI
ncbi:hypothetical protein C1H46_014356 [Malus baccata]|uniref:Uncharacterized protein n=1 Tax=Malus baccata TaxID=106549 RepID=A0A540MMG8_MALBA|nr:hypothetical protein C1H46_014356 [Malus baccata]